MMARVIERDVEPLPRESGTHRSVRMRPPVRSDLVARERLYDAIDLGRQCGAVWLAAPQGYGKTSLAAGYQAHRQLTPVWYHLESEDADPFLFAARLTEALQLIDIRVLPALTPEEGLSIDGFARLFFDALAERLPVGTLIILDNHQVLAADSPVHVLVCEGISRLPPGSWLIASRHPPVGRMATLLGNGSLTVLGIEDLRFTEDETAQVMRRENRARTTVELAHKVWERSEGWPAGVVLLLHEHHLAAMLATGQSLVSDYLHNLILHPLSGALRRFLMRTAWLPEVSPAMANELSGREDAADVLERLVSDHALVTRLPGTTPGYRYHTLLIETLQEAARSTLPAHEIRALIHRSATLLAAAGDPDRSIERFAEIGAFDELQAVIAFHAEGELSLGRVDRLAHWLRHLPAERIADSPEVQYWQGACLLPRNPSRAVEVLLAAFDILVQRGCSRLAYLAWSRCLEGHRLLWSLSPTMDILVNRLKQAERVLPLPADPLLHVRIVEGRYTAALWSAGFNKEFDELDPAALGVITNSTLPATIRGGTAASFLIRQIWHLGRRQPAADALNALESILDELPLHLRAGCAVQGQSFRMWFDPEPDFTRSSLESLAREVCQAGLTAVHTLVVSQIAYDALAQGRTEDAHGALDDMAASGDAEREHDSGHRHLLRAWADLQDGQLSAAREQLDAVIDRLFRNKHLAGDAVSSILLGRTLFRSGARQQGFSLLRRGRRLTRLLGSWNLEFLARLQLAVCLKEAGRHLLCNRAVAAAMAVGRQGGFVRCVFVSPDELATVVALACDLNIEPDYTKTLIRANRLRPPSGLPAERWPWPIRIHALGPLQIYENGVRKEFPARLPGKPLELLRALLSAGAESRSLDELADSLWPESDGDHARAALKTTVKRLRSLLGQCTVIQQGGRLRINEELVWLDVMAFERLVALDETRGDVADRLRRILAVYRGRLFADAAEDEVSLPARRRLAGLFAAAVARLCRELRDRNEITAALEGCRCAIELHPEQQILAIECIGLLLQIERHSEAVAVYENCCAAMRKEGEGPPGRLLRDLIAPWQ